jgi:hypothetical protein
MPEPPRRPALSAISSPKDAASIASGFPCCHCVLLMNGVLPGWFIEPFSWYRPALHACVSRATCSKRPPSFLPTDKRGNQIKSTSPPERRVIMPSLPLRHPTGLNTLYFLTVHVFFDFFLTAHPLEKTLRGAVEKKKESLKKLII